MSSESQTTENATEPPTNSGWLVITQFVANDSDANRLKEQIDALVRGQDANAHMMFSRLFWCVSND